MSGGRRLIAALIALCPIRADALVVSDVRVLFPGTVMINSYERRNDLLDLPIAERQVLCGEPYSGWPRHGPQKNITEYEQPGQDLALTSMRAAAVHLSADQPRDRRLTRRAIIHNLRYWAKHDGLSVFKGELHANHFYNLERTLLPLIVSYGLVRNDPDVSGKDRDDIEAWLGQIIRQRGPEREIDPRRVSARNNHSYLRASVTMAWGALEGEDELFQVGIRTFARALDQLDADGALPLELARGTFSLSYHRHALASLVAMAEMAAMQGYDLYGLTNAKGQSLHDLVDYLAAGLLEPGDQDLFFMELRGHGRHYMAWFEAYHARFPEREATEIIKTKMTGLKLFDAVLLDDYSGAVTSCLFRPTRP